MCTKKIEYYIGNYIFYKVILNTHSKKITYKKFTKR